MRTLVILNYQREIPPFMQMEISEVRKYFDNVFYVTRKLTNDNRETIAYKNVHMVEVSDKVRYSRLLTSPFCGIFDRNIKQVYQKCSLHYIKVYFTHYYCADCLYETAEPLLRQMSDRGDNITVLSTWLSVEATAACRLKKKFNGIKALSFAHSFEVIPERNPYLFQSWHEFHHRWLDKIYFISGKVMHHYLDGMRSLRVEERFKDRMAIRYLGSSKPGEYLNPENLTSRLEILTCSRIDENKRLGRIVDALSKWHSSMVHWTIIGDGSLKQEVEDCARKKLGANPLVSYAFLGQLSNDEIKEYYRNSPVDLFINVSKSEGLPVSIMEAISYGIPVMATDVGGTSEIVGPSNGFLLSSNFKDEEFLDTLKRFQEMPPDQRSSLRRSAYQLWEEKFNIVTTSAQMYTEWLN